MSDPQTPLPPEQNPAAEPPPEATVQLPAGAPQDPRRTVKMNLPPPPVRVESGRTESAPAAIEMGRPGAFGAKRLLGAVALLAVLGGAAYLLFFRGSAAGPEDRTAAPSAEAVPPGVQAYLDQARAGDAHAMRMLGVMYYYGLNVPQDRQKGLYWYRKAADQGSDAARDELAKLQAGTQ